MESVTRHETRDIDRCTVEAWASAPSPATTHRRPSPDGMRLTKELS